MRTLYIWYFTGNGSLWEQKLVPVDGRLLPWNDLRWCLKDRMMGNVRVRVA